MVGDRRPHWGEFDGAEREQSSSLVKLAFPFAISDGFQRGAVPAKPAAPLLTIARHGLTREISQEGSVFK